MSDDPTTDVDHDGALERWLPELKLAARHIPWLGESWALYFDDLVARRERRGAAVVAVFTDLSNESFDALLDRATDDPRFSDYVARVLEGSTRTRSTRKLRALGRALVSGYLARDEAALDEFELLLGALEQLETAHIKVLDHLVRHGSRHSSVPDYELARLFPNGVAVIYGLLKSLESLGLVGPTSPASDDPDTSIGWVPWDLGILLHQTLLDEGRPKPAGGE